MKKLLLSILLLSFTSINAQEFSMTDQGNQWAFRSYDPFCDPTNPEMDGCIETILNVYRINGETTINGTTYAIVERATNLTPSWFFSTLLREEEGLVYRYSESGGEHLLYDFTLEIGDFVEIDFPGDCSIDENENDLADVIDVSTQFIAGQNRKVITFDIINYSIFSVYEQWIEGIGSSIDLYNNFAVYCDYEISLNCFNNGTEVFNFFESDTECNGLLNLPEISKITSSLTPNPITEQATVTISTFQPNTSIAFYTILGQRITQKEMTSNTTIINRSDFPTSGIYFYQIQQQGQIVSTQKFIVK